MTNNFSPPSLFSLLTLYLIAFLSLSLSLRPATASFGNTASFGSNSKGMAAIVTGCLGAVGAKVGELILRQFKYLYCFRANITNLENEAEKLNSAQRVVISGEVETWLQKSNEIKREIDGILNEVPNVGSGCFSLGVPNECQGLPLALTTVGAALKDEVDVKAWKNAVGRLEKGGIGNVEEARNKMKGMVSNENNSGGGSNNAGIHGLFCPQQVSFGCLKQLKLHDGWNPFCSHTIDVSQLNGLEELRISKCAGSLSLFTSSMAGNLVNLKELWIEECDEMVEVIKDDEEKGMSGCRQRALLFPKLHKLKLWRLPK